MGNLMPILLKTSILFIVTSNCKRIITKKKIRLQYKAYFVRNVVKCNLQTN